MAVEVVEPSSIDRRFTPNEGREAGRQFDLTQVPPGVVEDIPRGGSQATGLLFREINALHRSDLLHLLHDRRASRTLHHLIEGWKRCSELESIDESTHSVRGRPSDSEPEPEYTFNQSLPEQLDD